MDGDYCTTWLQTEFYARPRMKTIIIFCAERKTGIIQHSYVSTYTLILNTKKITSHHITIKTTNGENFCTMQKDVAFNSSSSSTFNHPSPFFGVKNIFTQCAQVIGYIHIDMDTPPKNLITDNFCKLKRSIANLEMMNDDRLKVCF